jgi:hypothetical protein
MRRGLSFFGTSRAHGVLGAFVLTITAGVVQLGVGCGGGIPNYPLLIDPCDDGGECKPASGAGVGVGVGGSGGSSTSTSTSTSSTGGAPATSTLMGTVHRITANTFEDTGASFTSSATIQVYPSAGNEQSASYGGSSGASFTVKDLASGTAWLAVVDASGVWSTVSSVTAPQISSVTIPVIDDALVTSVAATLPSVQAKGVSATASHVVLFVTKSGAPASGISVSGTPGGAIVAYDTGSGTYSDTATATGSAGVVLLFDATLGGMTSITLEETGSQSTWKVPIFTGSGVVTVASASL